MQERQGNEHSKRRLVLRRHGAAMVTGVIAAAALAIPAAAAGYAAPGDPTAGAGPGPNTDTQAATTFTVRPNPDTQALVVHRDTQGTLVLHRDGAKAAPFVADVGVSHAAASGEGFDWGDAMIGAGAVLGIAALGAAGLTLRRRTAVGAGSVATGS
jgi:hypothetical protein